jgi:hypothetical protein
VEALAHLYYFLATTLGRVYAPHTLARGSAAAVAGRYDACGIKVRDDSMSKPILFLAMLAMLGLSACQPVQIMKTYTEEYTDPKTGKKITYTESIIQTPEERMPIHLKHPELYE